MKAANTQSQVNVIVRRYLDAQDDALIAMHALGLDTPEAQRPYLIRAVCEYTGATFNESATGKLMLNSKDKNYEWAKTRLRDIILALKGEKRSNGNKSSGKTDPVDALIAAFEKLDAKQRRAFLKAVV
jgi:hypothetical protein